MNHSIYYHRVFPVAEKIVKINIVSILEKYSNFEQTELIVVRKMTELHNYQYVLCFQVLFSQVLVYNHLSTNE